MAYSPIVRFYNAAGASLAERNLSYDGEFRHVDHKNDQGLNDPETKLQRHLICKAALTF